MVMSKCGLERVLGKYGGPFPLQKKDTRKRIIRKVIILRTRQRYYERNLLRYLSASALFVSHFKSSMQDRNFFLLNKCSER